MPASDLGEWLGSVLVADAAVKSAIFFQLMYDGTISPDYLAQTLRDLRREMLKDDPERPAAIVGKVSVERLHCELFGKDGKRLPAIRAQVRRERQRRNRFHQRRGY